MEVSAKKPVIRCVSGLSKAEKKKFRDNERMRIANLKGFHSMNAVLESMTVVKYISCKLNITIFEYIYLIFNYKKL